MKFDRVMRQMALWPCLLLGLMVVAQAQTVPSKAAPSKAGKAAAAAFGYTTEPAPSWVVPAAEGAAPALQPSAMHYRVIDRQVLVDGKSVVDYNHVVRVIDTEAGLSDAAQIELEFEPSYQSFALHHLDVVRNGKHLNKIDRKRIRLLQREPQLERRMVDGRVTLSVVLDDVRVGDQIDFAYTVRGANPVFDGRFADNERIASQRGPVSVYQVRLLAPSDRDIRSRIGPTDVSSESRLLGTRRETVLRRLGVARFDPEPNAPASIDLAQQVQFSEYADWADVARWGQHLFDGPAASPRADAIAQDIRARTTTAEERVLAALKFVQQQVRYFGTEMGANSHRPALPDTVVEQRFGDCKDKVGLFVALLRRLEVPATPVLVSTELRNGVERVLPGPLAFNHVIARVDLDGTSYWLDATREHQTGRLAARQAVDFWRGLALEGQTTALATLPESFDAERQVVEDTIRVERFADDPLLESRITYRGLYAEGVRSYAAGKGVQAVQTELAAPYLRAYPKATSQGPAVLVESEEDDAVTVVQRFSLPGFWRFPDEKLLVGDLVHWAVAEAVSVPKAERRRDPYQIALPGIYRHTVTLQFAEEVASKTSQQTATESDAHFNWRGSYETERTRTIARSQLRIGVGQIEAAAWPAYTAKLAQLMPHLASSATVSAISPAGIETLRAQLQAAEDDIRKQRVRPPTKVQVASRVRALVLSAQIDGGRLPPPLEAQARAARGIEYDNLARYTDAQADFTRALELAPEVTSTANDAAINALQSPDLARAVTLTSGVLARDPGDTRARKTRGIARYFLNETQAAREDLAELAKNPDSVREGYPLLWLSLAMRQAGQDPASLAATLNADQLPTEWPRPVLDFVFGKMSAEALIEAARKSPAPAEALCEAYFYVAERYRVDGDRTRAAEFWRKAVDQRIVEFIEHRAAQLRLAQTGGF